MARKIIPHNPKLKELARQLRNNSTKAEVRLWLHLKAKQRFGFDFHRQKPIDNFILDFFCNELMLGIEVNGYSHQLDEVQQRDAVKSRKLEELGITILRFNDDEIYKQVEQAILSIDGWIENWRESNQEHTPNPSQEGNDGCSE